MNTIVIGGGPAGMIAAISSSKVGDNVLLIEKNNMLGKKILITGKGRCNITSSIDITEFINNIPGNGKFLYSAFKNFTNNDILGLLKSEGIEAKEERGNRYFPVSNKAEDVRAALERIVKKSGIQVLLNYKVEKIIINDEGQVEAVIANGKKFKADKIILATGGKSYPNTGSTGDGYIIAKKLGHTITDIRGSLVPLISNDECCSNLQGLSLRNVKIEYIKATEEVKIEEVKFWDSPNI